METQNVMAGQNASDDKVATPTLGTEINMASRSGLSLGDGMNDVLTTTDRPMHTQLNRLITSRLPLCLPPHAQDPTLYAKGLEHFAHIYLTFESLFTELANPASSTLLEDPWIHVEPDESVTEGSPKTDKHRQLFATLIPQGLSRSRRLLSDLAYLKQQSVEDVVADMAKCPGPAVEEFYRHIRAETAKKPHVLIAYAWNFYMAVFSGGRWIRSELQKAGDKFWQPRTEVDVIAEKQTPLSERGLSFFHFESAEDGEDIKREFKARIEALGGFLTAEERADVVAEAQEIYGYCDRLVQELDQQVRASQTREALSPEPPGPWFIPVGLGTLALAVSCVSWYAMFQLGNPALT
jgi:heme oxygenase